MECEKCRFDLPQDWPLTKVAAPDDPTLLVEALLCEPCRRPLPPRVGPLIDYRALPPHVSAGRKK